MLFLDVDIIGWPQRFTGKAPSYLHLLCTMVMRGRQLNGKKGTCKHYRVPRKLTVYVAVMDSEAPSEYVVL